MVHVCELLGWDDVEGPVAHVHRARDYDTGEIKTVKAKLARRFTLEPNVLPLLAAMKRDAGGRSVVWPADVERGDDAATLRADLEAAGVSRAELFVSDKTRKNITAHDLRSTGITWRVVRGDDLAKIQRAAGHRTIETTNGYVREAEILRDGFGEVFPELPAELLAPPD